VPDSCENHAATEPDFVRSFLNLWVVLFLIWLCIASSFAADTVVVGAIACLVMAFLFAGRGGLWGRIPWSSRRLGHFLAYSGVFLVEMVRANLAMLRVVYAPQIAIRPGIVRIETRLQSPLGRLALANSIALTPGSLVLDIEENALFLHWLDVKTKDPDAAAKMLAGPFERHLEVVFG